MADNNRPTHRIIAKMTDSRQDRYETVGVCWQKERDEGGQLISVRLSPFVDGAKLALASSVLIVPNDDDATKAKRAAGPRTGRQPGDDDDGPPPDSYGEPRF